MPFHTQGVRHRDAHPLSIATPDDTYVIVVALQLLDQALDAGGLLINERQRHLQRTHHGRSTRNQLLD